MPRFDRRSLIGASASLGLLGACSSLSARAGALRRDPFTLGVAAGDPTPDGFVIWTRLAPDPLAPAGGMAPGPVPVAWEVATEPGFREIVQSGEGLALPQAAHSLHVEVPGLAAQRPYWYRFHAGGAVSETGCARTLPAPGAALDQLHIASVGCHDYERGFFSAFAHLAREPMLDAVFHYGDYIYEFGRRAKNPLRVHAGDETVTLDDYRRRYAQYKQDPDLRAAHARAAFICSFDDHEVDDNWAGDWGKDGGATAAFAARKAAALQAWYEHMPVRRALRPGSGARYFRRFEFGSLLRMHVLDTRSYRSNQLCETRGDDLICEQRDDPARTMLGAEQEAWLGRGMEQGPGWHFIAQQVLMLPFDVRADGQEAPLKSMDNWNGYTDARRRMAALIAERQLGNVVIGGGDMHQHLVGYLPSDLDDPLSPPLASEFLATSVTSGGSGSPRQAHQLHTLDHNPHVALLNNQRGYQLYRVDAGRWATDIKVLDQVDRPGGQLSNLATYVVEQGKPGPILL